MRIILNKKIQILLFSIICYTQTFADIEPPLEDLGLPFTGTSDKPHTFLSKGIAETVKYVGLLAVFSLTIGGIMYITSLGDDTKAKKARNLIVYSIVGVVVAGLAYALVGIVNSVGI